MFRLCLCFCQIKLRRSIVHVGLPSIALSPAPSPHRRHYWSRSSSSSSQSKTSGTGSGLDSSSATFDVACLLGRRRPSALSPSPASLPPPHSLMAQNREGLGFGGRWRIERVREARENKGSGSSQANMSPLFLCFYIFLFFSLIFNTT